MNKSPWWPDIYLWHFSPQETRVGAVKFSNIGTLQFDLNDYTDKPSMLRAVDRISYAGGFTNTSGGLRVMRSQCFNPQEGDRFDVPNIAIGEYFSQFLLYSLKALFHRSVRLTNDSARQLWLEIQRWIQRIREGGKGKGGNYPLLQLPIHLEANVNTEVM